MKGAIRLAISLAFGGLANAAQAAPPAPGSTYVALGSSYAAGTSLPSLAADSPPRCGQGVENYPRQIARALDLKLIDRSCGGAVTPHLLRGGQFDQAPQIAAIAADARLVTITIGGNDVRFVSDLGEMSCRFRASQGPGPAAPDACRPQSADFDLERAFATLADDLHTLAAQIRRQAPQARIVFVDYITIAPPSGTCVALGLSEADAERIRQRAARLAALTAKVAAESGSDLIEASRLSRTHDVCSSEPWAWGYVSPAERERAGGVGFHPRPEGIAAIAQAVVERLRR